MNVIPVTADWRFWDHTMFEKIIAEYLNKFFGNYFENIDVSHLNVSIWRGMGPAFVLVYSACGPLYIIA